MGRQNRGLRDEENPRADRNLRQVLHAVDTAKTCAESAHTALRQAAETELLVVPRELDNADTFLRRAGVS